MYGGLDLARPRRHKRRWIFLLAVAAIVLLVAAAPRLAAALPAGAARLDGLLGSWFVPQYARRLADLQQENTMLHTRLAQAGQALAENQALRSLLDCTRVEGSWQPGQVTARRSDGVTLACTGEIGAAVVDPMGRYAGRVVANDTPDCCEVAFAGSEQAPCAGLSGSTAGLLTRGRSWQLTGLPADCNLAEGAVVTTPGGYWLGVLSEVPQPEKDGLTARVQLDDTADLNSTVFFVKKF